MGEQVTIGKMSETVRDLPVELTLEEQENIKDNVLFKLSEIEKLEGKAAEIAANYRARIKVAKDELNDLRRSVESGTQQRKVACREEFHFTKGIARIYRLDTNKFVEERTILPDERQDDIEADVEAGKKSPPPTVPNPEKAPKG